MRRRGSSMEVWVTGRSFIPFIARDQTCAGQVMHEHMATRSCNYWYVFDRRLYIRAI